MPENLAKPQTLRQTCYELLIYYGACEVLDRFYELAYERQQSFERREVSNETTKKLDQLAEHLEKASRLAAEIEHTGSTPKDFWY